MRLKLAPGEQVLVRTRPSPRPLLWPTAAALVLLAAAGYALGWLGRPALRDQLQEWQPVGLLLVAGVAAALLTRIFLRPLLRWLNNRYILTNMRLVHRRGATRRSDNEVPLAAVYQLGTTQSLVQRMLGSGTLTLDLGYGRVLRYRDVPQVSTFREYLVEAVRGLPRTAMFDGADREIPAEDWRNRYEQVERGDAG